MAGPCPRPDIPKRRHERTHPALRYRPNNPYDWNRHATESKNNLTHHRRSGPDHPLPVSNTSTTCVPGGGAATAAMCRPPGFATAGDRPAKHSTTIDSNCCRSISSKYTPRRVSDPARATGIGERGNSFRRTARCVRLAGDVRRAAWRNQPDRAAGPSPIRELRVPP